MRRVATIAALVSAIAAICDGAGTAAAANVSALASGRPPYTYSFYPLSVEVAVGSPVRWTNDDSTFSPHTVTSVATDPSGKPLFDLTGDYHGLLLGYSQTPGFGPKGASVAQRFTAAGKYRYFCRIHAGMGGTVAVRDRVRPTGRKHRQVEVTWATAPPPPGAGYDLQRRYGHSWKYLLINTPRTAVAYPRHGGPFRSRLRYGGTLDDHTPWSPRSRVLKGRK